MIRIAVLGDIGSGKSYVAKQFGYPVFNADSEVAKLYRKSRKCHKKLKKALPEYIASFPIKKNEISKAIMGGHHNLKKIVKIVHPEVQSRMNNFIKKNKNKKIVILDIPLLMENKINKKNDILIFIDAKKKEINKRFKKKSNFNLKHMNNFTFPFHIEFIIHSPNFISKYITFHSLKILNMKNIYSWRII